MKISTVQDIEQDAGAMLREKGPVLVTRNGRLAGIFFPQPEATMPVELKRELYPVLAAEVARQVRDAGASEEEVLGDFAGWRKKRREARGGR